MLLSLALDQINHPFSSDRDPRGNGPACQVRQLPRACLFFKPAASQRSGHPSGLRCRSRAADDACAGQVYAGHPCKWHYTEGPDLTEYQNEPVGEVIGIY